MKKKNGSKGFLSKVPAWIWGVLSFLLALLVWWLISQSKHGGKVFASPLKVVNALISSAESGSLWKHFIASFRRIILGFLLAFACAVPVAFLLGWYKTLCRLVEPWIQFLKNRSESVV